MKRGVWDADRPPGAGRGRDAPHRAARHRRWRRDRTACWSSPTGGPRCSSGRTLFGGKPRQRALYEAVEQLGGSASVAHLRDPARVRHGAHPGAGRGGPRGDRGGGAGARSRSPARRARRRPTRSPTTSARALAQIEGAGRRARARCCSASPAAARRSCTSRRSGAGWPPGAGAIVLVPEIALTPQTVRRVRGDVRRPGGGAAQRALRRRAGRRLARAPARRAARRGRRAVGHLRAGGATSASSWWTRSTRRATSTARRRATTRATWPSVRARLEGARLVLGSATPSLESWTSARPGKRLRAAARCPSASARGSCRRWSWWTCAPRRRCPRLGRDSLVGGARRARSSRVLARGEQGILLLNRRGFAAFLQCPDCGARAGVPVLQHQPHGAPVAAGAPLPLLRARRRRSRTAARACGARGARRCAASARSSSSGWLAERFPAARLARMDLDTTSTKWAHHRILGTVERRRGGHPPRHADDRQGARLPERDAGGRGGRRHGAPPARLPRGGAHLPAARAGGGPRRAGPAGGRVVVQTRQPTHHALVRAAEHDAEGFLAEELALRASRRPIRPPRAS